MDRGRHSGLFGDRLKVRERAGDPYFTASVNLWMYATNVFTPNWKLTEIHQFGWSRGLFWSAH
jgi:hypothetical protein